MVDLGSALEAKKFDTRLIERNLTLGVISEEEVETRMRELPDLNHQAEKLKMDNSTNSDRFNY